MVRTQVYLPEDLYNELKLLSATGQGRFSDLIRKGVEKLVREKKARKKNNWDVWKSFIGAAKGGPKIDGVKAIRDYYENDVV